MATARQSRQSKGVQAVAALRQISTPREGLYLQVAEKARTGKAPADQRAGYVLTHLGEKISRPGVDQKRVFGDSRNRVYAYSVDPADPTRLLREDAAGRSVAGKVVNGSFKPLAPAKR